MRWVTRIVAAVMAASALYLLVANLLLYRTLRELRHPGLDVDWTIAYTLLPGRVTIRGARLATRDDPTWELEAERVELELDALALLGGRREVRRAQLHSANLTFGAHAIQGQVDLQLNEAWLSRDGWHVQRGTAHITGSAKSPAFSALRIVRSEVLLLSVDGSFSDGPSSGSAAIEATLGAEADWFVAQHPMNLSIRGSMVEGRLEPNSSLALSTARVVSMSRHGVELSLPSGLQLVARLTADPVRGVELRAEAPRAVLRAPELGASAELRGAVVLSGASPTADVWRVQSGKLKISSLRFGATQQDGAGEILRGEVTFHSGTLRRTQLSSLAGRLRLTGWSVNSLLESLNAPDVVKWMLSGYRDENIELSAALHAGSDVQALTDIGATAGHLRLRGFLQWSPDQLSGALLLLRGEPLLGLLIQHGTADVVWAVDEDWIEQQTAQVFDLSVSKHP